MPLFSYLFFFPLSELFLSPQGEKNFSLFHPKVSGDIKSNGFGDKDGGLDDGNRACN